MGYFTESIWLWVSAGGFVTSAGLFFYLLAQYRHTADGAAADEEDGEDEAGFSSAPDEPIKAVSVVESAKEAVKVQRFTPVDAKANAEAALARSTTPAPAAAAKANGPHALALASTPVKALKTEQTAPGGVSPAVLYLQNLKNQLGHLEKEVEGLKGQVQTFAQKHEDQFTALLDRLGELKDEVHEQTVASHQASTAAPIAAPVPAPAPVAVKTEDTAPLKLETIDEAIRQATSSPRPPAEAAGGATAPAEPVPADAGSAGPTSGTPADNKPAGAVGAEKATAAGSGTVPAAPAEKPAEEPRPQRRGPVWPV